MTELRAGAYAIPVAALGAENPFPRFRAREPHRTYKVGSSVPEEDRRHLGRFAGVRVLPYRMQDGYAAEPAPARLPSVELENDFLRAIFLPALGGRLISLTDKRTGRELLTRNPAIVFANVALRNAWFCGGVEWNVGQYGHHLLTSAPVFAGRARAERWPVLRLWEWDRLHRLAWHIDVHLPPDSAFLFVHARVVNASGTEAPMYWWTNMAVPEEPGVRTLTPADDALVHDGRDGLASAPLPLVNDTDVTYGGGAEGSTEIFFLVPPGRRPWIAGLNHEGFGLVETSTRKLRGRKLFAWGRNRGGRRWQEHLAAGGEPYIEIQAGLARTQMETVPMPAGSSWYWTEALGPLRADPALVHGSDWDAAWRAAAAELERALPRGRVEEVDRLAVAAAAEPPAEILAPASGWGALERRRLAVEQAPDVIPAALGFPDSTLGEAQAPWRSLLENGALPERDPVEDPGEWLIQPEWEALLEASVRAHAGDHWLSWLHLGVMRAERLDHAGAREAWERSVRLRPSAWAWRNLGRLHREEGRTGEGCDAMLRSWSLCPPFARMPLARECADDLLAAGRFAEAVGFIRELPADVLDDERVQIQLARASLGAGDLDAVERALDRRFHTVREGERILTDLWFEMWECRVAGREGVKIDDNLRDRVRREHPAPPHLDFRHGGA